jgi:threonine synthase
MGIVKSLRCPRCGSEPGSKTLFQCPSCGSILEVNVEIGHLMNADRKAIGDERDRTVWRWFDFFPVEHRSSIVSLGEGNTPLLYSERLGERLGIRRLYLKNDTVLPTGSLKDRSNSIGLSVARELGFMTSTVMSTGNAAASVAARRKLCSGTWRASSPSRPRQPQWRRPRNYALATLSVRTILSSATLPATD